MAFATPEQVAARLGVTFSDVQSEQAELLLDLATDAILGACDKDQAWADSLEDTPGTLRVVAIEVTARAIQGTPGLRSRQEQLGQYMLGETYISDGALALTLAEQLRCRDAVYGALTASPKLTESLVDDVLPYNDILPQFPYQDEELLPLGEQDG